MGRSHCGTGMDGLQFCAEMGKWERINYSVLRDRSFTVCYGNGEITLREGEG